MQSKVAMLVALAVGVLLGTLAATVSRGRAPGESAALAALVDGARSEGLLVTATPMGDSSVVIVLVDTERHKMTVYQADARRSRLRLLAVRDVSSDWLLDEYNNDPPLPRDIRQRVKQGS